jgi:hypothetical protein
MMEDEFDEGEEEQEKEERRQQKYLHNFMTMLLGAVAIVDLRYAFPFRPEQSQLLCLHAILGSCIPRQIEEFSIAKKRHRCHSQTRH